MKPVQEGYRLANVPLSDGGAIGIARADEQFALAIRGGAVVVSVTLTRAEMREHALRALEATQDDGGGRAA